VTLSWWRLELPSLPELEESLIWKLNTLGISRVALRHRPEAPEQRQLIAWEQQDDEDWSLSWKQHWQADPVGRRLLILPAWLELPPEHADRLVIRMDPGSAFGTGSHPTTRLCLEAIEELAERPVSAGSALPGSSAGLKGLRVADLGCGSGILGVAALLQGAASVAAADTDSLAVRATRDNAAVSGFSAQLQVDLGSVERLAELLEGRPADLLLCNILAPVIEALCPAFHTVLAADGLGLLSGLLVEQAPRLQAALAEQGWLAELTAQQSQWGLMTIRRGRGSPPDVA
jgi:ribosomal protein L11 methyltransferase